MNSKNNNTKAKVINIGKKKNKIEENGIKNKIHNNNKNNNQKKTIEPYNTKNNNYQYIKKNINLETTFDKNNNLSLFSFLSSNTSQEYKLTNKSLKTTKETENNQNNLKCSNIHTKKKLFLKSNKISSFKNTNTNIQKLKITDNTHINKELDKFKNRIDNLMKVIEDFEIKYINTNGNKKIKEELNQIIKKAYFNPHNSLKKTIELPIKQIYYTESNKNLFDKEINPNINKTMIIKNHKLNLKNNPSSQNSFYSTKNIKKKKMNNNNSIIWNRHKKNKKEYNKNNYNNKNTYNRRIDYSSLIEVKPINNTKNKKYNIVHQKQIKKTKPMTHHCPSKSNDIKSFQYIYNNNNNNKKRKEKGELTSNIYINPSFNKTPKIYRIKNRINNEIEKAKSNINNTNKKKNILKKKK